MAELEGRLRELPLDWPPQPDLTLAVRAAVASPRRRRFGRRSLAVAAAFAVPPARTAILRWLGLHHVRVGRVAELPRTRPLNGAVLGTRTSLVDATRRAGFELSLPRGEQPDSVYAAETEERRVGKECRSRWSPYH